MNTECTYKPIQVTISISLLSVMSVHSTVSHIIWVSTTIALIEIFLTIYVTPIWMPFGLAHKEHFITLLVCFLKKSIKAKIWALKCFQHQQVPFQLIMMVVCERILVCWPGQIAQVNMRPSKKNHPPARIGNKIKIFIWLVLLVEQHHRSFGVTKGYKWWLVTPLTLSGLLISWLAFAQVLVNA